jgi:flagellar basal body-associated protein FliL
MGTEAPPQGGKRNTLLIVVIVVVVLLCALALCVVVALALLGPALGNVFSNIVTELGTPTP